MIEIEYPVYGKDGIVGYTMIDAEDLPLVSRHSRLGLDQGYAIVYVPEFLRTYQLARLLLGLRPGDGKIVDHINRNRLDNRRCNLRLATPSENARNRPDRYGWVTTIFD